jgi:hypothetical protein
MKIALNGKNNGLSGWAVETGHALSLQQYLSFYTSLANNVTGSYGCMFNGY